jgi:hypothetical protein
MRTLTNRKRIMATRIRIEVFPGNSVYRKFHVSAMMSSEKLHGGSRLNPFQDMLSSMSGKVELTEDTKATILRFYDIDGISAVGIDSFEVNITRSPAYEWEELEPEIIIVVKSLAKWPEDAEVEIEYLMRGTLYPNGVSLAEYEAERSIFRQEMARAGHMSGGC